MTWTAVARAKGRIKAKQTARGRAAIAAWSAKGRRASAEARKGRSLSSSTKNKIAASLRSHYGTTRRLKSAHRRIAKKLAIHQRSQHRAITRRTSTRKAAKRR